MTSSFVTCSQRTPDGLQSLWLPVSSTGEHPAEMRGVYQIGVHVPQRGDDPPVQPRLYGSIGTSVLAREPAGDGDGLRDEPVSGLDTVDDPQGEGFAGKVTASGGHRLVANLRIHPGSDEVTQSRSEGDLPVDLREAEVGSIRLHDSVVVGEGKHGSAGGRMTVQGCDGRQWQLQHPSEQGMHGADQRRYLIGVSRDEPEV